MTTLCELKLFQEEKYSVLKGSGNSVGFCTGWNEVNAVFDGSQAVQDTVAILGTLYSRQGINVILRNLALNPQINKLFLWGHGKLSNTKFGVIGKEILCALWQGGVDADGLIVGTKFKVEKEIDREVLQKIITNVALVDVSEKELPEVEKLLQETPQDVGPYMESASFPDPEPEEVDTFPSENVGWLVRGKTVVEAWTRVVDRIMRYGVIKGTQYGYQQRELIGVTWVVSGADPANPDFSLIENWDLEQRELIGATKDGIEEYHEVFLSAEKPEGLHYTYGNRLMNWPYLEGTIDQIEDVMIKQLKASPDSRRAVATTMMPGLDWDSKEPPCITQVQALQSGGKLHFLATARSHDIFKAAIPNAFGLITLQNRVCEATGFERGCLQMTSQSAHIYEQDWEEAKKVASCYYWEHTPSLVFDAEKDSDPRGMVMISVADKIKVVIQSPDGMQLMELEGMTAKELGKKITHLKLLQREDHMMDIAMELQKAEIALMNKLEFHQDRPLGIGNVKL